MSAGYSHVAILDNGEVKCWGGKISRSVGGWAQRPRPKFNGQNLGLAEGPGIFQGGCFPAPFLIMGTFGGQNLLDSLGEDPPPLSRTKFNGHRPRPGPNGPGIFTGEFNRTILDNGARVGMMTMVGWAKGFLHEFRAFPVWLEVAIPGFLNRTGEGSGGGMTNVTVQPSVSPPYQPACPSTAARAQLRDTFSSKRGKNYLYVTATSLPRWGFLIFSIHQ
ncbi:MAG: hypothetical protein CM15mP71_1000 [Candidatus Poseidoniales archaeon]|nr:MAG: hypothetical protein CM15mP71_1000 [Candidatus Poseidoniales archaeon]